MSTVLSRRALNRATLARQHLLARVDLPAVDLVTRLGGLQAQTTHSWYVAFQSRLREPDPEAVGRTLTDGGLVRMSLMRSTLHLVTPEDARWLRGTTREVMARDLAHSTHGRATAGLDLDAVVDLGRAILEERPLGPKDLGARLAERWPEVPGTHLAYVVRCLLPVVQIPPRGVWGAVGSPVLAPADTWTGLPMDAAPDHERLVLRHLAAFGPASVRDVQAWSGLTRLAPVVSGLRDRLVTFRDEAGAELFDLPDAPRPGPDVPAPVRFLYDFDNVLRAHADRTRMISPDSLRRVTARNGMPPATVLVDGSVAASWKVDRDRRARTLDVFPFRPLDGSETEEIIEEGRRLLAFLSPIQEGHEIRLHDPD
ncbi:winged helix DNA-binding domain-containing protein [Nocardiopsis sp. MG754419]|uniref:winged helix DNA-binding domain-containing protein n=1 Tax=Nocardiopsis sp. MG754419 TaxID=2259865 RepID=UPI001BA5DC35|nr:winged helix DNA-binding domain-containing protein [Nocardiopsis sp. MG754419]MBR8740919.1 winged helix DNA-binding domain-containing protein [Nocardiopsis sp. MG754419]